MKLRSVAELQAFIRATEDNPPKDRSGWYAVLSKLNVGLSFLRQSFADDGDPSATTLKCPVRHANPVTFPEVQVKLRARKNAGTGVLHRTARAWCPACGALEIYDQDQDFARRTWYLPDARTKSVFGRAKTESRQRNVDRLVCHLPDSAGHACKENAAAGEAKKGPRGETEQALSPAKADEEGAA